MGSILKQSVVISMMMVFTVVLSVQLCFASSLVQNGNFAAGGDSWTTDGNVTFDAGYAEFSDESDPFYGTLYQGVEVTPGKTYSYSFEFLAGIELPDQQIGNFSDLFSTTLYFNSANYLNLSAPPPALDLFDLSGTTPPNMWRGEINPVANGYSRYFLTFEATDSWVFPTFDFSGLDLFTGGFARVDLVQLEEVQSAVPEPSTLLLSLGGAACLWFVRFRKRS